MDRAIYERVMSAGKVTPLDSEAMPFETLVRRALLAILVLGLVGTEIELFLLKHTDGFWQLVPVVLLGLTLALVIWCAARPGAAALRTLQVIMALFLLSGAVGIIQHFQGNLIDEGESNPGLGGRDLYKAAAMGATPLLAPGIMLQLGLVGLLFTFRHPALARPGDATSLS
jgi:hypothetical protein